MAFPHLKGKKYKMKLTLFKKVSKAVHFTVSRTKTMYNELSQPHIQGLFSPQQ